MKATIKGEGLAALFGNQSKSAPPATATEKELRQELHRPAELLSLYADMTPGNRERLLETARQLISMQAGE